MNNKLSGLAERFREEVGSNLRINEEARVLDSWLQTEYGGIHVVVHAVDEEYSHLVFTARSILSVPSTRREEFTKLLNMINWKLILGNFEMDPSDGELVFRTTYCLCEREISQEQFSHGFNNCMLTTLHNYPFFQKVIWNNATADEIFEENLSDESGAQYVSEVKTNDDAIPENYSEEAIEDLTKSLLDGFENLE